MREVGAVDRGEEEEEGGERGERHTKEVVAVDHSVEVAGEWR